MSTPAHHIIRLRGVTVRHQRVTALRAVTADLPCGGSIAICGPNGAGKSTLLRALLGWHALDSGEIHIGDTHPRHALPRMAYLPQRQDIDWEFPLSVRDIVAQGRSASIGWFRRAGAVDQARIHAALAELELADLADRPLRKLSGGQQQRVFLARAVAQGADIFLLDEPLASLDLRATHELLRIIRAWTMLGRTVVAVVHDLALARAHFDHALLLDTDLVSAGEAPLALSDSAIRRAYHLTDEGPPLGQTAPLSTGVFPR